MIASAVARTYILLRLPYCCSLIRRGCPRCRQVVNRALETDALIVLGDIKHLRKREQNKHGRKFNRKLAGFQYYKLTQYIKYKAAFVGIKMIQVSEHFTSQY
jgi:IS605 OrfB family transposase